MTSSPTYVLSYLRSYRLPSTVVLRLRSPVGTQFHHILGSAVFGGYRLNIDAIATVLWGKNIDGARYSKNFASLYHAVKFVMEVVPEANTHIY